MFNQGSSKFRPTYEIGLSDDEIKSRIIESWNRTMPTFGQRRVAHINEKQKRQEARRALRALKKELEGQFGKEIRSKAFGRALQALPAVISNVATWILRSQLHPESVKMKRDIIKGLNETIPGDVDDAMINFVMDNANDPLFNAGYKLSVKANEATSNWIKKLRSEKEDADLRRKYMREQVENNEKATEEGFQEWLSRRDAGQDSSSGSNQEEKGEEVP